jgi:hypothetical protein
MADPTQPQGDKLEGRYANSFSIGFNAYEFVFDFRQSYVEEDEHMHTRIITSPSSAQDLSALLQDSLGEHQLKYKPEDVKK